MAAELVSDEQRPAFEAYLEQTKRSTEIERQSTLREKTGVGMMECKKALTEADGDMDKAVEWLREKGLAAAAK